MGNISRKLLKGVTASIFTPDHKKLAEITLPFAFPELTVDVTTPCSPSSSKSTDSSSFHTTGADLVHHYTAGRKVSNQNLHRGTAF